MTSPARRKAKAGSVLLAALLALGALALTPDVTGDDLRADLAVRPFRSHLLTPVFLGLTSAAAEAAGLAMLAAGIIVLLARRRRWDAARLLLTAGAAWALAAGRALNSRSLLTHATAIPTGGQRMKAPLGGAHGRPRHRLPVLKGPGMPPLTHLEAAVVGLQASSDQQV